MRPVVEFRAVSDYLRAFTTAAVVKAVTGWSFFLWVRLDSWPRVSVTSRIRGDDFGRAGRTMLRICANCADRRVAPGQTQSRVRRRNAKSFVK